MQSHLSWAEVIKSEIFWRQREIAAKILLGAKEEGISGADCYNKPLKIESRLANPRAKERAGDTSAKAWRINPLALGELLVCYREYSYIFSRLLTMCIES